ncbi:hypothetical protein TVAG_467300 [Trichomonas vaginalis G3]|uniref:Glycosyltransferase 61 catalytic domain-containing protein n=1 Tax=Trichomonas vaginalis (strain ATCC PRA-98 / G3) TaxID=412133 RepID=A2FQD6_TRIV3|nr:glycosyltransferase family [Trichomonas vaginalis G3]EAX92883.1 hypothetical protein TVAG_467300 [Trichomonas vaginalis G3]KAI5494016.1 glycosyltransferase family [Trichomonas vaginalis G3]|eukprot:XP_001305813.1 hypothetical protein [Trichomonas vaginalis G3]
MKLLYSFLPVFEFIIIFTCSILYFGSTTVQKQEFIQKITHSTGVSKLIRSVTSKNDTVTITFSDDIDSSTVLNSCSLKTKWESENIIYPPNSYDVISNYNGVVQLRFFLPVVDKYEAELICDSKHFPVNLSITDFSETEISNNSQIRCHGKYFGTRWCEARNIYHVDRTFFFYSRAHFKFPNPLLVPGSRAPPFDKVTDRFAKEPIVTNITFDEIPRNGKQVIEETSLIYGVFYNFYMLWHMIYDFFIPYYSFINVRHQFATRDTRRLFVRSDGFWRFQALANWISRYEPIVLENRYKPYFFKYAIIGCEKPEANPDPYRNNEINSILFKYNLNSSTAPGFREDVIKYNNIHIENSTKPIVLFIKRGGAKRDVKNLDKIVELSKTICTFCDIRTVELQNLDIREQIELIAPAQVLIGFHGSGLAHVIWMEESRKQRQTHLIEIMPHEYNCRDWYETAASVARVNYHMLMNKKPVMPEGLNINDQNHLKGCWESKACGTQYCHDRLRDQFVDLEEDLFINEFKNITNTLMQ